MCPMKITFISKYNIVFYMLIKKYIITYKTETTSPHSATIAKPKEKPYYMRSMSARTNTRYGNISFK